MVKSKKKFSYLLLLLVPLLAFFAICSFWIYKPGLSSLKLKVLSFLPLPIASIGDEPLFARDFLEIKNSFGPADKVSDSEIYNALILNEKFTALQKQLGSKPIYKNNSDSKNTFKRYAAIKKGLALYYNSSPNLNSETYQLANNLLGRLKQGEAFEGLAKAYSQDSYSNVFGGLTGGSPDSFLPEVSATVGELKDKESVIIPSSLGLHIVKKDKQTGAPRQIFLKTAGFEDWLQNSSSEIKTKIYINP